MASDKVVETVIVGNYVEMETEGKPKSVKNKLSNFFWHGGSVYDAWFSCASNQVAQVLLTLPYSFSQLGMLSGILFQLFYGLLGSWTAYLISVLYVEYRTRKEREKVDFRNHVIQWFEVLDGLLGKYWRNVGLAFNCTFLLFGSVIQLIACASNIYYINDNLDKRTWTYIFGACCATTVFIPSFHNYRIWSFLGLVMTTYTAWYLTIASLLHGQVEGVKHSGPTKLVLYFTGATNILYTFGGHAVTGDHARNVEASEIQGHILTGYPVCADTDASIRYCCVLGIWRHASQSLQRFCSAPKITIQRHGCHSDAHPPGTLTIPIMHIHLHHIMLPHFITFGFACTPLYFVWEKAIGMHECKSLCKRAAARLPVVIPIWFLAIVFPFFGPINSTVGSLLVSFTVYIIPALAHIFTFKSASARENAVEQPPKFVGRWVGTCTINVFVVVWVLVVGFGFGGWASVTNFVHQIDTFGLFTKCFQCPPPTLPPSPIPHIVNATAPTPLHHPHLHRP
ncbi:auxin transporter-like protein 5 [Fagus crenata]